MSQYRTSGDVIAKKKISDEQKNLAGDYLAEKGYERQIKPREINGGRDRLPQNYTQKNKARLNNALSSTPAQAKNNPAKTVVSKKPSSSASARVGAAGKAKSVQNTVNIAGVRREKAKTPFPVMPILLVVAFTVIALYVIHLYIELDDLNSTITDYNNQIVEMKKEESMLKSQKAGKYNLEEIERIAKEEYGMVDADQLPKEYITPDAEDSIEIMETSIEDETPGALLSGFAGVVSNLLSYIN